MQLVAFEVGIFFKITNQLLTQSSILFMKKTPQNKNIYHRGFKQTHSMFAIGILKHNMMYLNMKTIHICKLLQ